MQDTRLLDASVVDEGACFAGEILKDDFFWFEPQLAMMRTDPIASTAHRAVGPAANHECRRRISTSDMELLLCQSCNWPCSGISFTITVAVFRIGFDEYVA